MLFIREIGYRKVNFLLGLLGMIAAVAFVVAFYTLTQASRNETRLLTRGMGFNLRILPGATDMEDFWISGYSKCFMPEEYVDRLVKERSLMFAHLTATLHKKISWRDQEVILTGISPDEREPGGIRRSKMIFAVKPDKVVVGYEIARKFNISKGDQLEILSQTFQVENTLSETASTDDIRLYFDLKTLQHLLQLDGKINEIMALNCICFTKTEDPLSELRQELHRILPDTRIVMNKTIAVARERQRVMNDKYFYTLLPFLLVIALIWLGATTMINASSRMQEVGTLTALGFGGGRIAELFFARAALTGLVAALVGYWIGTGLAMNYGVEIFKVSAHAIRPIHKLLLYAVLSTPLFSCLAAFIPVMWTISRDTAKNLKNE